MPLAPLPPETTPRMNIRYTAAGQEHLAQVRLAVGSSSAAAVTAYNTIAPAMAAILPLADSVLGADYIAEGSTISNPLAVDPVDGEVSIPYDTDRVPVFISFTGRSSDGRKVKWSMYAPLTDTTSTGYRDNSPDSLLEDVRQALITAGARTISGGTPVWHSYVNYGQNAYWQRQRRYSSS